MTTGNRHKKKRPHRTAGMQRLPDRIALKQIIKKTLRGLKEHLKKGFARTFENLRSSWARLDKKKLILTNIPMMLVFYLADKGFWLYRHCVGQTMIVRIGVMLLNYPLAFQKRMLSFQKEDLFAGLSAVLFVKGILLYRKQNAKKYRKGEEYGSADGAMQRTSLHIWIRRMRTISS